MSIMCFDYILLAWNLEGRREMEWFLKYSWCGSDKTLYWLEIDDGEGWGCLITEHV